jgi:FKBP-type peptidyl-prolyl cis-trans isomerase FklB
MKAPVATVLCMAFLSGVCAAAEKQESKERKDKISYSVGYQVGGDFKRQGVELDPKLFLKGFQDAMSGAKPHMTPQEMNQTLVDLKKKIVADERKDRQAKAQKALAEGEAFLAANAKKEGVVTHPSGLQYKVLREGAGASPKATDNVTVNYRGTLVDGTEFDSSYKRNKPATFRVDRVIPGWTQALTMMKTGAKWQLFIPAKLAYGDRGAGTKIPPGSTLIFDVELVSVQPAP